MQQHDPCTICNLPQQITGAGEITMAFRTWCERCGIYDWGFDAPKPQKEDHIVKMSGFVRDQNKAGIYPQFTRASVERVIQMPMPSLMERADRLLLGIVKSCGYKRGWYRFSDDIELQALSYSANDDEILILLEILEIEALLENNGGIWRILPRGYLQAERSIGSASNAYQGFVAMSFDASMNESFTNGFDPAIRMAGYKSLRIDQKEHVNGISDEIITEIRRSHFMVADYTHGKGGVYFEAGFAMGLGRVVIPTCHKDFMDGVHFDVRHINTLVWETVDQLRDDLAKRISAVIGDGPLRPTGSA